MTSNLNRGSATIYQFPTGGRAGLSDHRSAAEQAAEQAARNLPKIAFGSSWYHEAAVEEADRPRKN